jgi:hypothetical protein
MDKVVYVSDSQLIINLLFNSPFYGSYITFYKYPYFYRDDLAADFLFARGIALEEELIENVGKILSEFGSGPPEIIPDLILLLNTFRQYYNSQTENNPQIPFNLGSHKALREISTLKKLLNRYKNLKHKGRIQIDFTFDQEEFRLTEEPLTKEIMNFLDGLSETSEYKSIFKFQFIEESELLYRNFLKIFPKENISIKDNIKLWTLKQSSMILFAYLEKKVVTGISDKSVGAEFTEGLTGKLLTLIDFLPNETLFRENQYLTTSFNSYRTFLTKTVKSYLVSGKRISNIN